MRLIEIKTINRNYVRCSFEEIDCIKKNSLNKNYSTPNKMKIHLHILWIYIKMMLKQLKETEDYVR